MPVIPTAISTQSIPGSTGMPQMSSADPIGAALEQSGQQLGRSANQVQHFLAVRDNLRKSNDAESMVFDFKDKANLIAESMKTDPTMNETKVKEQIDGIISQYQEKTDPDVWQYAQKHIMAESHALISTARAKDTNREVDRAKALTERTLFEGIREAARPGNTPEQITEIKGRMTGDILGKVQVGVFTAQEGQVMIQKLDETIAAEYFTQLGQVDPTKALSELKNTDKGSMAYQLNPVKRNELIDKFDREAKGQKVTSLLVELETKHANPKDQTAGLVEALNEAESTEFLKANGVEIQSAVMTNITNKLRRKQQEIKINDGNIIGELNKAMVKNALTDDAIVKSGLSSEAQGIMMRALRAYTNEQRSIARQGRSLNIAERQEARVSKQEKSDVIYGQILSDIVTGKEVNPLKIISRQTDGLTAADSNKLIEDLTKIQNNPDLKSAYKLIDDKFSRVDPVKASKLKKDIYLANVQGGVTGTALIEQAKTAIDAGKKNIVGDLLNNVWDSIGSKKQAQPSQADLEYTAKQHNMTVEQVKQKLGIK